MGILLGLLTALTWGGADFIARFATHRIGALRSMLYMQLTGFLLDRKSTRLNSSHRCISYAVFCLKKKKKKIITTSYLHPGIICKLHMFIVSCHYTRCSSRHR